MRKQIPTYSLAAVEINVRLDRPAASGQASGIVLPAVSVTTENPMEV